VRCVGFAVSPRDGFAFLSTPTVAGAHLLNVKNSVTNERSWRTLERRLGEVRRIFFPHAPGHRKNVRRRW
jgi:hypothetical protein